MQRCIMIQTIILPSTFLIQIKQLDSEAAGFWKKVRKYKNLNLNLLIPKVQENQYEINDG
jgi:hypothetical protein